MKCPWCNADVQVNAFGPHGVPLSFGLGVIESVFLPEAWQVACPHCKFSGPRQSSKTAAEAAVRRLCGQDQEA